MNSQKNFEALCSDLAAKRINRRDFFAQATALGVGLPAIATAISTTSAVAQEDGAEPTEGGSATIALFQEPNTINRYVSSRSADTWIAHLTIDGLLAPTPDGEYEPALAAEVPSLDNGGISEDGLTYTYALREDVLWSDGEPMTSADVIFTYNMIMDDANPISSRTLYESMDSIEAPDDYTVVITYSQLEPGALGAFGSGVIPEHYFDGNTDLSGTDFDREPVGTGPFVVTSWVASEAITFERNPNYREEGKPYLDEIIIAIVPSPDVATAQLEAGEVDMVLTLREDQAVYLEEQNLDHIELLVADSPSVERVQFNLAAPGSPADPDEPHPVLGDPAVREALSLATPREEIVTDLIGGGVVTVTGSTLPFGWAAPDPPLEAPDYDIDAANALLDEAGWEMNGDVREKDGQQLTLSTASTPEQHRTLTMQILAERWGMIGVQLDVSNQQSTVLLGSWNEDGTRAIGNFDGILYASSAGIDPHQHFRTRYHSDSIPTEENGGAGSNFGRLSDPDLDALINEAGESVDQEERRALYREINEVLNSHHANIWVYSRTSIDAYNTRLGGLVPNSWRSSTGHAQDWFIVDQD